ncbi:FYVE, RhoGEF and PH domain-containing protein 6-like [Neosynchiropus ocellatus]
MRKPPLAPKPKFAPPHMPGFLPLIQRREGLSQQTPGSPVRVKPAVAPKPCPARLSALGGWSSVGPKSLHLSAVIAKTVGILNSQNGVQQENKGPNWDYIIPICLCSNPNCMCIRSAHAIDKRVKDLKSDANVKDRDVEDDDKNAESHVEKTTSTSSLTTNRLPPLEQNLQTNIDTSRIVHFNPSFPRGVSNSTTAANAPEEDACIPELVAVLHEPKFACTALEKPGPSPSTPKTLLTCQQEVVEEKESQSGGRKKETEGVSSSDSERRLSQFVSAKKSPAPPPKKKLFLSLAEQMPTTAVPADVVEEDLGWDCNPHEMELSVDPEEVFREEEGCYEPGCSSGLTLEFHLPSAERGDAKAVLEEPLRCSSPMAWSLPTKEKNPQAERVRFKTRLDCILKERVRGLSFPPCEKTKAREGPASGKLSRSSYGRQRPKSFSGADSTPTGTQRSTSFRKLLHLKLPRFWGKAVQEMPVNRSTGHVRPCSQPEPLRSQRKYSCPLVGVEQSVDGDEFSFTTEPSHDYENVAVYEEIQDYEVMTGGMEDTSHLPPPPADWLRRTRDDDEGIYEETELYMSLAGTSGNQHVDEPVDRNSPELSVGHEGPSDDDTIEQTSDEGDDGSSVSSSERTTPDRPKKSKVQYIATEIMCSEAVFVDVLKLLHVDFRDAVSRASQQSGKPVIEDRLLNQILYSLPQLYQLNLDLLLELKMRLVKWDENSQLADVFLKKGPYLKMYSSYIRAFEKNAALLEEQTRKNAAFRAVVRGFEASPRCAKLTLKHYLIKPVQRIPQYQMLLRDYVKNLPQDSVEFKNAEVALRIVKEVADHANDIMKHGDNFQKVIQVQCRLSGRHEILQPGRLFLKEGTLKKLSRKGMQPRTLFLFNDTLLYTTPAKSGHYRLNNMLSLAGMKVSKPSQEAYQNELIIESVERSFILSASSAAERDVWLEAISTAIDEYTKKKITFLTGKISEEMASGENGDGCALGSKAPIWIPDVRATMCMICTCEFTLMWRRHHCRACGKVVCKSCSSNRQCLEYLKNRAARVCDRCYIVINQPECKFLFRLAPFQKFHTVRTVASTPPVVAGEASLSPSKSGFAFRRQKKIPAALKEVSANTGNSSISGYMRRSKGSKKQWRQLWFVIQDKVLYTYAASEDVAALESQPLLGFSLKEDPAQESHFKLYHKDTLYYTFKVDNQQIARRWIEAFKDSTAL